MTYWASFGSRSAEYEIYKRDHLFYSYRPASLCPNFTASHSLTLLHYVGYPKHSEPMLWRRWWWIDPVVQCLQGTRDSKAFLMWSFTSALPNVQSTVAGCVKPIEPSSGNPPWILNIEHEIIFTISDPDDENGKRLTFNELQDKLININALINYFRETTPPMSFNVEAVLHDGYISSATRFIVHRDEANPTLLS